MDNKRTVRAKADVLQELLGEVEIISKSRDITYADVIAIANSISLRLTVAQIWGPPKPVSGDIALCHNCGFEF